MSRLGVLGLLVGLVGCGSSFGAFDDVPTGNDVSAEPWPRLVDTPEPPEARLTAGTGEQATQRLSGLRSETEQRLARADAVQPVPDSLLARGEASRSRPVNAIPSIDEAGLLARAAQLEARTAVPPPAVDDVDLLARAAQVQARAQSASSAVDETDLLARAALLRQRTSEQNEIGEDSLLARGAQAQATGASSGQSAPVLPRPPVPLRPLDVPVVTSSFEERARLARERAAGL